MTELVEFQLSDGGKLLVAVNADEQGVARATRPGEILEATATSFRAALSTVKTAAGDALREFRDAVDSPAEIKIEFGVLLSAGVSAVVAKTGAEGHLKVTVTWQAAAPSGLE